MVKMIEHIFSNTIALSMYIDLSKMQQMILLNQKLELK